MILISPYKNTFRVSQAYRHLRSDGTYHQGYDLVGIGDKHIYSPVYGTVIRAGWECATLPKKGFGQRVVLRVLSKKLGELKWTQADLARATGIRPTTISDYYNEIAERMNLNHLDLICEALDCEPDEILVRVPNPEPRVRNRTGFEKPATESKVGI